MTAAVKDRSMATGPYPVSITKLNAVPIRVEGSWCGGGYNTRLVGFGYRITMSDGSIVPCPHPHGHKKKETLVACATRLIARLNAEAGIPKEAR